MTEDFEFIDRAGAPAAADFCIIISDSSMLPYLHPGERIYLSCREPLCDMDVGLFLYQSHILCRQYCEDYAGVLHLLCANPACESENISISRAARGDCLCLGKVLLPRRLPPPVYD